MCVSVNKCVDDCDWVNVAPVLTTLSPYDKKKKTAGLRFSILSLFKWLVDKPDEQI